MTITRRRVPGKRMAAAAALSACLCVPAVAHAEADGNAHAWLVSGTPLTQTLNVWVHQEQSDAPSPLTVTAQIAVAGRTIASTAPVTTPAVTEFQTVAIDLTVPATVLAQARSAARAARVGWTKILRRDCHHFTHRTFPEIPPRRFRCRFPGAILAREERI